jgi:hypothetical protein
VLSLGYTITSLQVATPGQPGHIRAKKEGTTKDGVVTITCSDSGAVVEPEKTSLPIPKLVGAAEAPGEFPQMFQQAFNILRSRKEYDVRQGPEKGLVMTMVQMNSFESQMDFGTDLPAGGVLPVKVEISNNTSRPYAVEASKIFLEPASGGRIAPMSPPAAGQGKALQGDITLQPGQVVSAYLFYPAGNYSSWRTMFTDKESEEREGFSGQF